MTLHCTFACLRHGCAAVLNGSIRAVRGAVANGEADLRRRGISARVLWMMMRTPALFETLSRDLGAFFAHALFLSHRFPLYFAQLL